MAKAVVATMLIQHDREKIQIGEVLDPKKFTEEQLLRLYSRGAVKIVDESEVKKKADEDAKALEDVLSGTKSKEQADAEEAERKRVEEEKAKEKQRLQQEAADAKAKADAAAKAVPKK